MIHPIYTLKLKYLSQVDEYSRSVAEAAERLKNRLPEIELEYWNTQLKTNTIRANILIEVIKDLEAHLNKQK